MSMARWTATLLGLFAGPAWAQTCAPANAPHPTKTIETMYSAAMAGDKGAMLATFAPGFYAFDGGRRYSGPELAGLIDMLKAAHRTMTWAVNDPQEQIACDIALVTWDNRGTSADSSGTQRLEWLESAVERWEGGRWKLVFFHSTRTTPPR